MICITNLSKAYGTRQLLQDVTYHFPSGEKIALVGDNGAGKSTLLNILCQLEHLDSGTITKPHQVKIGYLPQQPNPTPLSSILEECKNGHKELVHLSLQLEATLQVMTDHPSDDNCLNYENILQKFQNAGGFEWEANAKAILVGLGFAQSDFSNHPSSLSGGWRMRLELAKLFLASPDFLILDEPTNHLDLPSLVWVENFLQSFKGTLLFVSHDRKLLNKLATVTLHLNNGKLKSYAGNYDAFLHAQAISYAHQQATFTQLEKKKDQLERFVERFGAKATKAKQAQSKQKIIDKLSEQQSTLELPTQQATIAFTLPEPPPIERVTCTVKQLDIGYKATHILSKNINLQIERGQKIAVIGANGIGKSTLLRTLIGLINPLGGEIQLASKAIISFFAQDQLDTLKPNESVLQNTTQLGEIPEKEARSLLGSFLFRGDDVFKPVHVLSGGEKSRVGLAVSLAKKANFLFLDEPTNHLDMHSVEALIAALQKFKGTVIFVSHDRNFIDSICTHVFAMVSDGRSMLFEGKLDDYEHLSAIAGFPNVLHAANNESSNQPSINQETHREKKELKQERKKLEKNIAIFEKTSHELEQQIKKLDEQSNQIPGSDFVSLTKIQEEKDKLIAQLSEIEANWLIAQEELENLS